MTCGIYMTIYQIKGSNILSHKTDAAETERIGIKSI